MLLCHKGTIFAFFESTDVFLNQRNISLIRKNIPSVYGQKKNFLDLKKVWLNQRKRE